MEGRRWGRRRGGGGMEKGGRVMRGGVKRRERGREWRLGGEEGKGRRGDEWESWIRV